MSPSNICQGAHETPPGVPVYHLSSEARNKITGSGSQVCQLSCWVDYRE